VLCVYVLCCVVYVLYCVVCVCVCVCVCMFVFYRLNELHSRPPVVILRVVVALRVVVVNSKGAYGRCFLCGF